MSGSVAIVGAGPGAPDLITVRGARAIDSADVIVYDRLVDPDLLRLAKPHALLVYAGKTPGVASISQDDINAMLLHHARAGKRVVRLKGGDPFVFGRGGEEALACIAAGVTFEVIPGVSSALAAPAAAGIPVTHRGIAGSVYIASPTAGDGVDWEAAARADTVVVLMAVERLRACADALQRHGVAGDTPAAMIEDATLPTQRVIRASLAQIAEEAARAAVRPPALFIVGETVALGDVLQSSDISSPAVATPGAATRA